MRVGPHTEKQYPLHNCTHDTLKVLLKSSDPEVVAVGKLIQSKKRRPRFDIWIASQCEREDGVGRFARWLLAERGDGRFVMHLSATPPEHLLRFFANARWHGVEFPEEEERGLTQAVEEWDRWGV